MKKYIVRLESEERARLEELVRAGKAAAYRIRHADVLLAVDVSEGSAKLRDAEASKAFGISVRSIKYLQQRCVEEGLPAALERKKREHRSVQWNDDRNHRSKKIDWQFQTSNARIKLRKLYPQITLG